jgi:superfamily II DNA or RNA helicase
MSITLSKNISNKLLQYQIDHTLNLITILNKNNSALDASDTGTGKTYCAIATCKHFNLDPIIVCPKSVISSWNKVCKFFDIKPFGSLPSSGFVV